MEALPVAACAMFHQKERPYAFDSEVTRGEETDEGREGRHLLRLSDRRVVDKR